MVNSNETDVVGMASVVMSQLGPVKPGNKGREK